jgi:hypothetical protein
MASAFEWLESAARISYPFEDNLDGGLKSVIVDAYVACSRALDNCRIRLSLFDSIARRVMLTYANGTTLFDLQAPTNCTYSEYDFGTIYRVHEWRSLADTDDDVVVRFTSVKDSLTGLEPIAPADAWLLRSLVDQRASVVRRLGMKLPDLPCCTGGGIEEGYFIIRAGYNLSLAVASVTSGVRDRTVIAIDAVPGAGAGQYPGCGLAEDGLRSIGDQEPDEFGNVNLSGDSCLWVERPLDTPGYTPPPGSKVDYEATVEENTIKLHDDCKACCDCSDYGAAYQALRNTWLNLKSVSKSIEITRKKYNDLVARTNLDFCSKGFVAMIRCMERPDYMASVVVVIANRSSSPLSAYIRMSATPDYGSYLPNSGLVEVMQPGGEPAKLKEDLSPIKVMKYPVQEDEDLDPPPDIPEEGITNMGISLPTIPAGSTLRFYFDMRFMAGVDDLKQSFNGTILHDPNKRSGTYTMVTSVGQTFAGLQEGDMFRTFYVGDEYVSYPLGEITGYTWVPIPPPDPRAPGEWVKNYSIISLDSGPPIPILVPIPMKVYRNRRIGLTSTLTATVYTSLGTTAVSDVVNLEAPKGKV